ncbi:MAG: LysR family transcriptional regulator [Rhodobacteraceae bacterium]|nr:LysR family transcriptional regulator [Paracoccaceae bacterium]
MELKWLKDFLTLSATGNFRIAAQIRSVSQPAFSRRIQALESWVEAPLIDRSCQPSQLTEAGRLFLPQAQKIVDLAKAARTDVQRLMLEEQEKMRFAILATLAQIFLPGWLKTLQPHIEANQFIVRTQYSTIDEYFEALEENIVDFFVVYEDPNLPHRDNTQLFSSLTLAKERLIPVVSPKENGKPNLWLPDHPSEPIPCLHTLSPRSPWPIRHHMENHYQDLVFKSVYDSSVATTIRAMALEGFGMAWVPYTLIADDLKNRRLVRTAEPKDDILVDIKIYRHLKNDEARVDKFWQVLLRQPDEAQ